VVTFAFSFSGKTRSFDRRNNFPFFGCLRFEMDKFTAAAGTLIAAVSRCRLGFHQRHGIHFNTKTQSTIKGVINFLPRLGGGC
jgi:hypothetical protein